MLQRRLVRLNLGRNYPEQEWTVKKREPTNAAIKSIWKDLWDDFESRAKEQLAMSSKEPEHIVDKSIWWQRKGVELRPAMVSID